MASVKDVKRLDYFADKSKTRLIVAGMYLKNGNIAFVDRKNSSLLVTDALNDSFYPIDLGELLPDEYRALSDRRKIPKPSDVNKGFEEDQLLITYTGDTYSIAVACELQRKNEKYTLSPPLIIVRINDRTRSVIALDGNTVCADTKYSIVVKNKKDNNDVNIKRHPRKFPDRGGLLMTDGQGWFYYGDGDSFVRCYWDGEKIQPKLPNVVHPQMKLPRGSAVAQLSGRIFICTDSSNAIFSISKHGNDIRREMVDGRCKYGDIDFHPEGKKFFTTFWKENEWPILYEIM